MMKEQDFSFRFWLALVLAGLVAGLVGIGLTYLLHFVQHWAFVGSPQWGGEHIAFRELVAEASPLRRFVVVVVCGLLVGLGWFLIARWGAPLMDVKTAVQQPERNMPLKTTICHALLQIVTVGMGSPLGREVAPREMSVALNTPLTRMLRLTTEQKQVLLACASGAGLAAVYNVPLAATVFILETLLFSLTMQSVLSALLCCSVAVLVSRWGLGDWVQYADLPNLSQAEIAPAMLVWSLLTGLVLAVGVQIFGWSHTKLPNIQRRRPMWIVTAVVAFVLIAVIALWFPEILGNGKAGAELGFSAVLTWQQALALLAAKWVAIWLAAAGGAYGGRITPSIMIGGMLAIVLAFAWNAMLPEIHVGAAAFVGAAVFLGVAQQMRLTAIVFMLELSRLSTAYWLPVCLCMASALWAQTLLERWRKDKFVI